MKGLELCEKFYNEYGSSILKDQFKDLLPFIAVGVAGSGSECLGFDDETSQDHDFEPGFCIFVPDEDIVTESQFFQLEKAYSKLPKEFMGYKRSTLSPVGGNRHGVIRTPQFFTSKAGTKNGKLDTYQWFNIPENSLLEAVNGKIFEDNYGEVTAIRNKLQYLPQEVRLKKLAGNILIMGQAGQYNYPRCIKRGDTAAAQLSVIEFVNSTINAIFLINEKYRPYYKWCFKALRNLDKLSFVADKLEYLISSGNQPQEVLLKQEITEEIAKEVIAELKAQRLTKEDVTELEVQAYAVNNNIKNGDIRNLHILYGI